jgi:hypothetical protein
MSLRCKSTDRLIRALVRIAAGKQIGGSGVDSISGLVTLRHENDVSEQFLSVRLADLSRSAGATSTNIVVSS